MEDSKINELIATHIMGLKSQVDFGRWDTHDWIRDSEDEIDEFVMDIEGHNGPGCKRCHESYCIECEGEKIFKEPCIIEPPSYVSDGKLPSIDMSRLFDKILKDGYKVRVSFINDNYFCMLNDVSVVDKNISRAMCKAILMVNNIQI